MDTTRIITGAILIPLLLVVVWFLPPAYFTLLIIAAAVVGQRELYGMARARGLAPLEVAGYVLGALLIGGEFNRAWFSNSPLAIMLSSLPVAVIAVLTLRLFSRRPVEGALADMAVTLFGILYVAYLLGFQVGIHRWHGGRSWLLFLYFTIWASDIGAYYIGTAYGKRRLYEKISPKKSVEGLIGGTAAAMVVAAACRYLFMRNLGIAEALVLGAVLALVGTVGDLVESLIKRSAGVKDSGSIFPGHGGVLDRFDSLLFAAPVLYYYIRMR